MINEISLYLPDKPGEFDRCLTALAEADVNVLAFSVDRAGPYSILKLICDDPHKAEEQLNKYAFGVSKTKVLAIPLPHRPGQLRKVTEVLASHRINVDYGYLTLRPKNNTAIVLLKTNNDKVARRILRRKGLRDLISIEQR